MPTTTPFNNLITFSRGSNATVTGPNGLIQWAPNNLLTFSEQFDNAAWGKVRITAAANTTVAPDGTTTADTLNGSGGGTTSISQTMPAVGGLHTATIYAKAGTKSVIQFSANAFAWGADARANFDIANGVLGTVDAGLTATITPIGDGWFRCAVTANKASTAGALLWCIVDSATAAREASATAGSVIFWGAQLELGSTATTYNSTTVKNLLGFSEAFDNAAWVKSNSSIVTGAQANPVNGLFTAQKLMENTANTAHRVQQTVNISGAPITLSAYLKAGERTWAYLRLDDASSVKFAYFNLATGAAGFTTSGVTSSITSVGSGWYRCSITFAAPAATAIGTGVIGSTTADNTATNVGDGNSGVYIYGAQLSDSASLDPYVPTPGAAPSSTAFYGPRFDFDPVTLQPRGLLVEEQRTNLVLYSDDWSNAIWSKAASNCAITSNATVSPDGTTNADKLIPLAGATDGRTNQAVTGSAGTTYTLSVYGKQAEFTNCRLYADDGGSNLASVSYNLATGAIFTAATVAGTWTSVSTTITPVGNGWWRMTLTWTATGAAPTRIAYWCRDTGNGTSGIFIYGAQFEAGAFATSYIPTVASTVTRSADVAEITGSNFAGWYNSTQGTLLAQSTDAGPNTAALFGLGTNIMRVGGGRGQVFVAGSNDANLGGALTGIVKHALGYATNDMAFSANGGAVAVDTSCLVPSGINQLRLNSGVGTYANGHIRSVSFIPARAADFQLQGLST